MLLLTSYLVILSPSSFLLPTPVVFLRSFFFPFSTSAFFVLPSSFFLSSAFLLCLFRSFLLWYSFLLPFSFFRLSLALVFPSSFLLHSSPFIGLPSSTFPPNCSFIYLIIYLHIRHTSEKARTDAKRNYKRNQHI